MPACWLFWNKNAEGKNTGSLYICSLSPTSDYEPQLCDPLDYPSGGDTVLGAQAYCVLLSACLGIKATFLFPPKNVYFHKGIRFLYSCSFQHCFRKVNRLICWKEENLVINADYRSGTAKVEKESKGQREKTFLFHCSIGNSFQVSVVGEGHQETGFLHALVLLLQ